jgi:hypothetical protein
MIDPKSLRIGNTVNCLHHNNDSPDPVKFNVPVTIAEIHADCLILSTGQRVELKYFSGIPLSEQELIRLGFTKAKNGVVFDHPSPAVPEDEHKDLGTSYPSFFFNNRPEVKKWMDAHTRVAVEYVHQLQNLYYSLTGTELTYKVENETIKP